MPLGKILSLKVLSPKAFRALYKVTEENMDIKDRIVRDLTDPLFILVIIVCSVLVLGGII